MPKPTVTFLKKLQKPPKKAKKDFHYWADYIELLCLINQDGVFSQNDFIDRIKSTNRELEDSEDFDGDKKNIDENEESDLFAEDCFKILEYRATSFNDYYPFTLSDSKKNIHIVNPLSDKHKIYLFLLFSSNLGYFNESKSELTSSFERLSFEALNNILPSPNSKRYLLGSSNIEKIVDEEQKISSFWDKLNLLATNIKENVTIKKEAFSKYHKGDGGLDIVGWIELGDSNPHFPLFFCQCACTPEWVGKQNSSQYNRWSNFISLSTYPLNLIFIPFSYRSSNGDWHEPYLIEKSILMDRLRLIYNFIPSEAKFKEFESFKVIEKILQQKESIV